MNAKRRAQRTKAALARYVEALPPQITGAMFAAPSPRALAAIHNASMGFPPAPLETRTLNVHERAVERASRDGVPIVDGIAQLAQSHFAEVHETDPDFIALDAEWSSRRWGERERHRRIRDLLPEWRAAEHSRRVTMAAGELCRMLSSSGYDAMHIVLEAQRFMRGATEYRQKRALGQLPRALRDAWALNEAVCRSRLGG